MPWIDASDIILDPAIAGECFQVIRRLQAVNSFGEVSTANTTYFDVIGSITPTGDNSMVREDASQSQAKTIKVVTAFRLNGVAQDSSGNQYQPDLILWHGDYYIVRMLNDYSAYGAGMVEAECTSYDFIDQQPQASP